MKITPKWSSKRTTYEQKGCTYLPEIIYREMWLVEKTGAEILVEIAEANSKRVQPWPGLTCLYCLHAYIVGPCISFEEHFCCVPFPSFSSWSWRRWLLSAAAWETGWPCASRVRLKQISRIFQYMSVGFPSVHCTGYCTVPWRTIFGTLGCVFPINTGRLF